MDSTAADREHLGNVITDLLRHADRNRGVPDIGQQRHELVAAVPAGHILRANARLDPGAHRREQPVGRGMPKPVVDGLEAVEVDEQECESTPTGICRVHGIPQAFREAEAVRETGDDIATGGAARSRGAARCGFERLPKAPVLGFHAFLDLQSGTQPRFCAFERIDRFDE